MKNIQEKLKKFSSLNYQFHLWNCQLLRFFLNYHIHWYKKRIHWYENEWCVICEIHVFLHFEPTKNKKQFLLFLLSVDQLLVFEWPYSLIWRKNFPTIFLFSLIILDSSNLKKLEFKRKCFYKKLIKWYQHKHMKCKWKGSLLWYCSF